MTQKEEWEKEFDNVFPNGRIYLEGNEGAYTEMPFIEKIKDFIRKALLSQKQELLREVDRLYWESDGEHAKFYNKALTNVTNLLT